VEHNHTDTNRTWHIPSFIWIAGVGLLVALLAIVFFNVPVSTVVTWSIFMALMFGSHFLHGGHGDHDSRYGQQSNPSSDASDQVYATQPVKDDQTNHRRGCH
jgi:hypothetical protein